MLLKHRSSSISMSPYRTSGAHCVSLVSQLFLWELWVIRLSYMHFMCAVLVIWWFLNHNFLYHDIWYWNWFLTQISKLESCYFWIVNSHFVVKTEKTILLVPKWMTFECYFLTAGGLIGTYVFIFLLHM